jgi:hypothetical protein
MAGERTCDAGKAVAPFEIRVKQVEMTGIGEMTRALVLIVIVLSSLLGGVMVSVVATGTKGHQFTPGRGSGFLRAIKVRSTSFFGCKVKPEAPCRRILRHVKDPLMHLRYWYRMQNSYSFVHSSYSLPDVSAGRIVRKLWWTSWEFSPAGIIIIITVALHAHISPGGWTIGPLLAAVLRRKFHLIDMIMKSIKVRSGVEWSAIQNTYVGDGKYTFT